MTVDNKQSYRVKIWKISTKTKNTPQNGNFSINICKILNCLDIQNISGWSEKKQKNAFAGYFAWKLTNLPIFAQKLTTNLHIHWFNVDHQKKVSGQNMKNSEIFRNIFNKIKIFQKIPNSFDSSQDGRVNSKGWQL